MDAQRLRFRTLTILMPLLIGVSCLNSVYSATFQTRNFSVSAENPDVAEQVGQKAEILRSQLATYWLGEPLPNWSKPCKIRVREGAHGAGGQTTFQFVGGEVLNWNMYVQGSLERILDSVLPHEINHTVFACHFRRPLPRWADEGAATLFEDRSEQLKQLALLNEVIRSDRERFSLQRLMSMKEYPEGMRPMLILYAQGYALVDFLIQQKGRKAYLKFLADGEKLGWDEAIKSNFDHEGVESLERNWKGWVLAGMPSLTVPKNESIASATASQSTARPKSTGERVDPAAKMVPPTKRSSIRVANPAIVRSQSPEGASMQEVARTAQTSGQTQHPATTIDSSLTLSDGPTAAAVLDSTAEEHRAIPRRGTIEAPKPVFSATRTAQVAAKSQDLLRAEIQPLTNDQVRLEPVAPSASTDNGATSLFFETTGDDMSQTETASERSQQLLQFSPTSTGKDGVAESEQPEFWQAPVKTTGAAEFESVHLPRERNVVSGSTPQWAGFPGQKKLF